MGAINVIVEEDGAEKSAEPMHVKLREMCGFTSVNVESPPDEEELGSIDRVDKCSFVYAEATEFGVRKVHFKKSGGGNGYTTLDRNKASLDTCTSYHTFFAPELLTNISDSPTIMKGRCNAGTTSTRRQGSYGQSCVWLDKRGIANLLSVPILEESGYIVSSHTKKEWEVTNPEGVIITFKRDTVICKGMPYIDLCEEKTGLAMIQGTKAWS